MSHDNFAVSVSFQKRAEIACKITTPLAVWKSTSLRLRTCIRVAAVLIIVHSPAAAQATLESPGLVLGAPSVGLLALHKLCGFLVVPGQLEALTESHAVSTIYPSSIFWVDGAMFEHRNFEDLFALLRPVPRGHFIIRDHER